MSRATTSTIAVYDSIADHYASSIEKYYVPEHRDAFIAAVPEGTKILDAGCAAGRDSRYFDSKGLDVVGVDLSEKLLAIAKKKSPHIDFQKQDIRSLSFVPNSFGGIFAVAVLLHLERSEVLSVLKSFWRLLQPGGVLCVQLKEGVGEADVQDVLSEGQFRHFTYFTKDEIEKLLEDAGFIIDQTTRYNEKEINPTWRDLVWIHCLAHKE